MSRRALALAIGVVVLGASTFATVVVPTDFREVVAKATLIVRGHLTAVRAVLVPGSGADTIGTIAVDRVVKGAAGEFVSIRVPGGDIGRYRYVMVGAPTLRVGEQAVFFLARGSDNVFRPVGLTMGIFQIHAEPITGRGLVDPPLVEGRTASTGPVVRGDPRRRPMPVGDFESLVQVVMASASASSAAGSRR